MTWAFLPKNTKCKRHLEHSTTMLDLLVGLIALSPKKTSRCEVVHSDYKLENLVPSHSPTCKMSHHHTFNTLCGLSRYLFNIYTFYSSSFSPLSFSLASLGSFPFQHEYGIWNVRSWERKKKRDGRREGEEKAGWQAGWHYYSWV